MNIFSNIGMTELLVILLLALLVIGPERLPELGRKLGKLLRDFRRAYDNLTRDLGPELRSLEKSTREIRESVDAVRSIPRDAIKAVTEAADLEETAAELRQAASGVAELKATLASAEKAIRSPVQTAVSSARDNLLPPPSSPGSSDEAGASTADVPLPTESLPSEPHSE